MAENTVQQKGQFINLADGNYPNVQNATGSSLEDTIAGNYLDNILTGEAANDHLWGGPSGSDTLIGGSGNDCYWYGYNNGEDFIAEDNTNGNDTVVLYDYDFSASAIDFQLSGNDLQLVINNNNTLTLQNWYTSSSAGQVTKALLPDQLIYSFDVTGFVSIDMSAQSNDQLLNLHDAPYTTIKNVLGGSGNDSLAGNTLNNNLSGGSGADFLWGGLNGDDTLTGGEGNDIFWVGSNDGHDIITDANSSDIVYFYNASLNDLEFSTNGNDLDIILGDSDNYTTVKNWSSISSSQGTIQFLTSDGSIRTFNDSIWSLDLTYKPSSANIDISDTILTNIGNVNGTYFDDTLLGNTLDNTLFGGNNDDMLWGAAGNDYLTGGSGADTYWFGAGDGNDTITANTDNANDAVAFWGLSPSELTVTQSGSNLVIFSAVGDSLTIVDWYKSSEDQIKIWKF